MITAKESTPLETLRANYKAQMEAAAVRRKESEQNLVWAAHAEARAAKYLEAIETLEREGVK